MRLRRLFLLLLALPVLAAATPFLFRQTEITIVALGPRPGAAVPAPVAADPKSKTPPAPPATPAQRQFQLKAQMRPASTLQQPDLFSVDPFVHTQAHLFLFDPPALTGFRAPAIQKPVDMVAINVNGVIQEIIPQAIPATLDPSQYSVEEPVRALLFLPPGSVDANGIRPGDRVLNAVFTVKPEKRN